MVFAITFANSSATPDARKFSVNAQVAQKSNGDQAATGGLLFKAAPQPGLSEKAAKAQDVDPVNTLRFSILMITYCQYFAATFLWSFGIISQDAVVWDHVVIAKNLDSIGFLRLRVNPRW